jgi:hypothetical protein
MAFAIETMTTYCIVGTATKIKWCVDKEVMECEGVKYLKLARNYWSPFAKICKEDNPNIPFPEPPKYSLAASVGYTELVKLRNEATEHQRDALAIAAVPELFRGDDFDVKRARKVQLKHCARVQETQTRIIVAIPGLVDTDGWQATIEMLTPLSSRDDICIRFDDNTIALTIKWLKQSRWTANNFHQKNTNTNNVFARKTWHGETCWFKKMEDGKFKKCNESGELIHVTVLDGAESDHGQYMNSEVFLAGEDGEEPNDDAPECDVSEADEDGEEHNDDAPDEQQTEHAGADACQGVSDTEPFVSSGVGAPVVNAKFHGGKVQLSMREYFK